MKKRANLITRVALAATIFVTALAGVTPMTAKAAQYTITYKANGGTGEDKPVQTADGGGFTLAAANTFTAPENKYFIGWKVGSETELKAAETSFSVNEDTDVLAVWDNIKLTGISVSKAPAKVNYTVGESFDPTGMEVTATYTGKPDEKITPTSYSPATTAALQASDTKVTIYYIAYGETKTAEQSITVTAAPTTTYTVTYNLAGGSHTATTDYDSDTDLSKLALRSAATRTGFTFDGWSLSTGKVKNAGAALEASDFTGPNTSKSVTATALWADATGATASSNTYNKADTARKAITISPTPSTAAITKVFFGSDWADAQNNALASPNVTISNGVATLSTAYLDTLPSDINYRFWAQIGGSAYPVSIKVTGTNSVTGTLAEIESVKWRSNYNGANLGSISSMGKTYTDDPRTAVYEVGGEIEFTNGTPFADIISELKKSTQVDIDLNKESEVHHGSVTWLTASKKSSTLPYNNTEADSDQMNTYDIDSKKEDSFIVYSEPIEIWSDEDKYHIDSAGTKNIRLKLKVKILAEGETANTSTSTGSSAPTNLTFNPGDGTYVTPNSIIRFSATASSGTVKYNVTSGNIPPTTSNGADGANGVTIPSSVSAGDYKMNVNAYTNSSNTTTKSATFKVVTNNKYNVTYDNGVLTCDGDFGNFKGLWITNAAGQYEFVPAANYAVASGSTIVTLSPTYLTTQTGAKSVRMVYTDGYAEGNFTLTAGSSNTPTNITDPTAGNTSGSTQGGGRSGVGTDDRSELVIMFVLLGMLIAGFVVSVYYKNEKLRRNRYMD